MIYEQGEWKELILSTNQVVFNRDGSATVTLLGIKNDYKRDGFEVPIRPASNARLDSVRTLKAYVERTKYHRPKGNPLFLSLKKPFNAISAKTVSWILEKSIANAGLTGQGYSAKSFRPTGATSAVDAGINPDTIRKIGRWKSSETFETHYIHSRPPLSFTDNILQLKTTGDVWMFGRTNEKNYPREDL